VLLRGRTRVRDHRLDVGRLDPADADAGGELAFCDHLAKVGAKLVLSVRRRVLVEVVDVLLVGQDPGHLVEVDAVFAGENAAGPDTGGYGVGAYPGLLALEVLGAVDARFGVADGGVVGEARYRE